MDIDDERHEAPAAMSIRRFSFALPLCLLACQSGPRPFTDGDRITIRSLEDSFAKLVVTGGFQSLVELYYEENAMLLSPNQPPAVGRAAIENALRAYPPITAFSLKAQEIEGAGDLAWSCGTYTLTMNIPGVPGPVKDEGNTMVIYRRQRDGAWRAWRDIYNSTLPAPGSTEEAKPAETKQ